MSSRRARPNNIQTHEILVTLAERPYPFPSRTRKSSSPAPKILRGQPFGKIGRRQDFCVSGGRGGPGILFGGEPPPPRARRPRFPRRRARGDRRGAPPATPPTPPRTRARRPD